MSANNTQPSTSAHPPSPSPRSRPVSMPSASPRTRSFLLPTKPTDAPVPPRLATSKFLLSPQSMFRRALSDPHLPSQDDDEWLGDQIPIGGNSEEGVAISRLSGVILVVRRTDDIEGALRRGRSTEWHTDLEKTKRSASASMSSPPLVRQRLPTATPTSKADDWFKRSNNAIAPTRSQTIRS